MKTILLGAWEVKGWAKSTIPIIEGGLIVSVGN